MSSSDRPAAIGVISGFLRAPPLNACSCLRMYCWCWPARLGHSGFELLPSGAVTGDARGGLGLPLLGRAFGERAGARTQAQSGQQEHEERRHSAKGFIWQNSKAAGGAQKARNCTLAALAAACPSPNVAQRMPQFPEATFHHQRLAAAPVSCRRRGRGRVRRPLECRQVQRAERHHRPQGPGAHQQDAGPHAADQFFRPGRRAAAGRPAGLRLRESAGAHAGSTGRSC